MRLFHPHHLYQCFSTSPHSLSSLTTTSHSLSHLTTASYCFTFLPLHKPSISHCLPSPSTSWRHHFPPPNVFSALVFPVPNSSFALIRFLTSNRLQPAVVAPRNGFLHPAALCTHPVSLPNTPKHRPHPAAVAALQSVCRLASSTKQLRNKCYS